MKNKTTVKLTMKQEVEELKKEVDYWKSAYDAMSLNHTHEMYDNAKRAMAFEELLKCAESKLLMEAMYELFNYKRDKDWKENNKGD